MIVSCGNIYQIITINTHVCKYYAVELNYVIYGVIFLQGVVIKYNEPEEARIPKIRWRLYPFKGDEVLRKFYVC